jgi:hypothetical protein
LPQDLWGREKEMDKASGKQNIPIPGIMTEEKRIRQNGSSQEKGTLFLYAFHFQQEIQLAKKQGSEQLSGLPK